VASSLLNPSAKINSSNSHRHNQYTESSKSNFNLNKITTTQKLNNLSTIYKGMFCNKIRLNILFLRKCIISEKHNFPPLNHTTQRIDSDSNDSIPHNDNHDWQAVKNRKRPRVNYNNTTPNPAITHNKYEVLLKQPTNNETTNLSSSNATEKIPKPPPIYVYGVVDFKKMLDNFATVVPEETYRCISLPNDTVKINMSSPDTYRTLIRHLNQEKIVHHTY
jgi:hypothetical protein